MKKAISFKYVFIWIITIVVLVVFPHTGIAPNFLYSLPLLLLVYLVLKLSKETFNDIGFSFKRLNIKAALIGIVAGIVIFGFINQIFFPALEKIVSLKPANLADFKFIRGNFFNYIFIVVMGWIIGGFYEEIIFHGFIFTRLEKIITGKYATHASFLITNIIFAFYHIQLGATGIINAFIAGCCYHVLMIYFKRNIWYAFFSHAIFDTIAITLIFLGYW